MYVRTHRDLIVWLRAMEVAAEVYVLAKRLPASERNGLASQMKRAAASFCANIAEGAGRYHRGDYLRFITIARGSQMELDTHLELAVRVGFLGEPDIARARGLLDETGKMLARLMRVLAGERQSVSPRVRSP